MFISQGSRDNMSVVLICFPGAPKVSSEAVKREAELDKYLESRVEGKHKKPGNEKGKCWLGINVSVDEINLCSI